MAGIQLDNGQLDAVNQLKNGCILCGSVGSGKSRTALAYYYKKQGGEIGTKKYVPMGLPWQPQPKDLYIITTARKRDTLDWEGEMVPFLITTNRSKSIYQHNVVVDSWNNIKKYSEVKNAFFIFDEQRVVGRGAWVKSFLKIAKNNEWILLSATPGDTWQDYIPVFIANGFYKNRTEFTNAHFIYSRFSKFPKVERYLNTSRLVRLRERILVNIDYKKTTISHHESLYMEYDELAYKRMMKSRWNIWDNCPIRTAGELCYSLRKIVNSDPSRGKEVLKLLQKHKRIIIFYNFDYELEILKELNYGQFIEVAEWNGHKHQPMPEGESWVYLVQYTAGCEAWNCVATNAIVFYSQNYSYKITSQASGRIDRRNTRYRDLYYYHFKSRASIDLMIARALACKKDFNEGIFMQRSKAA